MIEALAKQLTTALASLPTPRELAQHRQAQHRQAKSFAPALAYGRHRGPAHDKSRRAAVAIAILQRDDGSIFVPLTMRPQSLRHHGGQVSLPGGKMEDGESALQAALREFEEELGLPLPHVTYCGRLPPLYVYGSDNLVSPIVLVGKAPVIPWQPDLFEVDRVIELPLEQLLIKQPAVGLLRNRRLINAGETVGEFKFNAPAIRYEGHRVWGATAILLGELSDLFKQFR